jgi:hypothetical protein
MNNGVKQPYMPNYAYHSLVIQLKPLREEIPPKSRTMFCEA